MPDAARSVLSDSIRSLKLQVWAGLGFSSGWLRWNPDVAAAAEFGNSPREQAMVSAGTFPHQVQTAGGRFGGRGPARAPSVDSLPHGWTGG